MQQQAPARPVSPRRVGRRKKPGSGKRLLIRVAAVVIGLVFLVVVGTALLAKSLINKKFVTEQIEKSINSEVHIGDVDVSLLSFPAKVTLSDVHLKDKNAPASRPAPVKIREATLRVGLWSLLRKHLDITRISIDGAEIDTTWHEDGSTSIEKLFASPDGKKRSSKRRKKGGFNVFEQEDFIATLGRLEIKNSTITIVLESMGLRLSCLDVDIELDSIKIDPGDLAKTNSADLKLYSHVKIDSTKGWPYGELFLSGSSSTRIFDPVTGDAEPEVSGDFSLGKESWLNSRIPFITRSWNQLSLLEKVGITVVGLPERATFGRSEAIAAHYHRGKITVKKPLSVWVGDWELATLENSWLQTRTDQHEIHAELLASKKSSVRFRGVIMAGVEMLPDRVRELVAEDMEKRLFRDQRLLVRVKSSGDFSDPKIRPEGVIMDFAEAAKRAAKKLLKEKTGGLLDGLLGGDDEDQQDD